MDLIFHIAAVADGEIELLGAGHSESRVEYDRSCTDASKPFVEPISGVFSRQVVNGQLKFETTENFMVLVLSQVGAECGFIEVGSLFLVGDINFNLVEQVMTFRHVLSGTA